MNNLEWAAENMSWLFFGFDCPQCAYMGDRCYREQPENERDERICAKGHAEWLMQPHEEPSDSICGNGCDGCGCEAAKEESGHERASEASNGTCPDANGTCPVGKDGKPIKKGEKVFGEDNIAWEVFAICDHPTHSVIGQRGGTANRIMRPLRPEWLDHDRDSFGRIIREASESTDFAGNIGLGKFRELVERCERLAERS